MPLELIKQLQILNRYITREFLKVFFLSLSAFILIYLVVDVLDNVNRFIKRDVSLSTTMQFFMFKIPLIVLQVVPVATLLSSVITLGILSRNNEIVAAMASGISLYRVVAPIIGISILISILSFIGNESVLPYTNHRARHIENVALKKGKPLGSFKQNRIWYRSHNAVYNIDLFDPERNTLKGVTIYYLDKDFKLSARIDAETARWVDEKWLFYNVSSRSFHNGEEVKMERWSEKVIPIPEVPDDFKIVEKSTDEMSYINLRNYVMKIRAEGYDATKYVVDMHARIAFPFVNLIMPLLGIPFALRTERGKGIVRGVGISIVISFAYWVMLSFSLSLGHSGILPPIVSAWIANLIFLMLGVFMLLHVR